MAKKLGTLFALFLACYFGAQYYLQWTRRRGEPVGAHARLANCDPNRVRGLRIERKQGDTLEFTRTDQFRAGVPAATSLEYSEWKWRKDPEEEADASLLTHLARLFCNLYRPQVAEAAELKESAGDAKLVSMVTEREGDSEMHEIRFGQVDGHGENVVSYRDPAGAVRTARVGAELLHAASEAPQNFKNLRVLRMSADAVQALGLLEPKGERFRLERTGTGWSVSVRGKEIGAGSERATQYVNRLGTLKALSATPKGNVDCAQAPYKLHLTLEGIADRREDLYLNYEDEGPVQVCNTARPSLFTVHRDLLTYVDVRAAWLTQP